MPTPKDLLIVARDPSVIKDVYAEVKKKYVKTFPKNGCAATLSLLLKRAGFAVTVEPDAGDLVVQLRNHGWEMVLKENGFKEGDIFVTVDTGGNPGADHVGIVHGAVKGDKDSYLAIDNKLEAPAYAPYARNIDAGGYTRVHYWLRWPAA